MFLRPKLFNPGKRLLDVSLDAPLSGVSLLELTNNLSKVGKNFHLSLQQSNPIKLSLL
jgi:hypothetical protein